MQKRCLNCGWMIREGEDQQKDERSRRTIDHFTETGHTIVTLPDPINAEMPG